MNTLTVACNQCGAPLRIQDETRFVTCNHCNSQLKIHRDAGAIFSEQIEALDRRTDRLSQEVENLKVDRELEKLQARWKQEHRRLGLAKEGQETDSSSRLDSVAAGVLGIGFGAIWTVMAYSMTSGSSLEGAAMFPLFGVAFMIAGGIYAVIGYLRANRIEEVDACFRRERARLIASKKSPIAAPQLTSPSHKKESPFPEIFEAPDPEPPDDPA